MGRENKKQSVAALHRDQIMKAAEALFSEKGFEQTTIDDISKAADYSRRTVYAYFESKDDILHHIIEKGLLALKSEIENAVQNTDDFLLQYKAICAAMVKYQRDCPHSSESITKASAASLNCADLPDTVKRILALGTDINERLCKFIENGKKSGVVREDVVPMMSVYVMWSSITSLISLAKSKGAYICKQFSVTENEFLDYGFRQIINSVLTDRI